MAIRSTNNPYSILLVLTQYPIDSPFITNKLVELNKIAKADIIAWDTDDNKKKYSEILKHKGCSASILHGSQKFRFSKAVFLFLSNFLFIITNFRTIKRFIREGKKIIGKKIYVRLYWDFPFIKSKHDIWHFEFGVYGVHAYYLKKIFPERKFIISFRGYDLNYIGLADPNFYKNVWDNFDGFHFLGNDLKHRAIKRGYPGSKNETIIPPAIDTSVFNPGDRTKVSHNKLIILSVGRLTWKKGHEYGIRAVALLKAQNISFEYHIIGAGEHLQAIQFTISELGLENDVKLLGRKDAAEIRTALSTANVFLHPAVSEGFCNAVLEAQAMGVPVICTNADGLRENIEDSVTGFFVPKWDVQAMAEKLEWCWRNKEKLQDMGNAGIKRVHEKFRLDQQINSFDSFYRDLLESK
jgi:colanic acid/amylovoran biosynthesis glycosyltransferase